MAVIPTDSDEFAGDVVAHVTRMGFCKQGTRVMRIANAGSASEMVRGAPSIAASTTRRTGGAEGGVAAVDAAGEGVALTLNLVEEDGGRVGVCCKLEVWVGLVQGMENSVATCADVNATPKIRACAIAPENMPPPFASPS